MGSSDTDDAVAAKTAACMLSSLLEDHNAAELARHGNFTALAEELDAAVAAATSIAAAAAGGSEGGFLSWTTPANDAEAVAVATSVSFLLCVIGWLVHRQQQRARLVAWLDGVYAAHAPAQRSNVPALVAQFEGREGELRTLVTKKYLGEGGKKKDE